MARLNIKYIARKLFIAIRPIIELLDPPSRTGRHRADLWKTFFTIVWKLQSGTAWHDFDNNNDFVPGSTANDRHIKWSKLGIYNIIYFILSTLYDKVVGFKLKWQSVDATKCQAPVRGELLNTEGRGRNPTDRGFSGTKISIQVDQKGAPLGLVVAGANVHDSKLLEDTINEAKKNILATLGDKKYEMNLCLDKGYFGQPSEVVTFVNGFTAHIRSRGEEKEEKENGKKPRRWVAEQTFAILKSYHGLRTRYSRKLVNYRGFAVLASSIILFKRVCKRITLPKITEIMNKEFIDSELRRYHAVSLFVSTNP